MARLMEELQASRATIKRELEYMRLFMHAPIEYDRDSNGYRYDPGAPAFELPGLWFNASELYALLAIDQLLTQMQPALLAPSIGPLKKRIRELLRQSGHSAQTVSQHIQLASVAGRRVEAEHFGAVAEALLGGRRLGLRYHGRASGDRGPRRVHPHRLLHYRDNWYLIAWCETRQALRTFSLDRIDATEPSDLTVDPLDSRHLDRHTGAAFGIFSGEARDWAVLRFTPERARWVADEHWHPDQIGHWDGSHYQLQVPYSDPRELILDILKYGPDVEVIAPDALRSEVAQRLRAAAAQYPEPPQG